MFDQSRQHEAYERTEEVVDRAASERDLDPETRDALGALWSAWIGLTGTLLAFGIPQRAMCDAAGEVVSINERAGDSARTS